MKIHYVFAMACLLATSTHRLHAQTQQAADSNYRNGSEAGGTVAPEVVPKIGPVEEQIRPWLANCERRINRILEKDLLKSFSCKFNLDSQGKACSLAVVKPSGSSDFDQAVLNAIKTAHLYPPANRLALLQSRGLQLEVIDNHHVRMRLGKENSNKSL